MGREISIAISARDNYTQAITTMRNANQAFNKDVTGLTQKLDTLNKNKVTLKVEADKAKATLKEAEKQFAATGDAADKMILEMAGANYENANRNLRLVSQNAKQAEKDILNLTDSVSKSQNRAGGSLGGESTIINSLASAGAVKMLGDTMTNMASAYIGSAFGSTGSTIFGNLLSSAASGAAIGTMVGGPGLGTAIGGATGSLLGLVNSAAELYGEKDEAFKAAVQESYQEVMERQNKSLTRGTEIAAVREQAKISFTTMLGSEEAADEYLEKMTDFGNVTPFEYEQLAKISKTLLAYGYQAEELIPLLTKIGDAGSALGLSAEDINNVATALGRMQITGKTTMEYLNPLLDRGIPVWKYLAEASGKTSEQVQKMVSKGLVPGAEAARALADYMGGDYKGAMEIFSRSYPGLLSTLEDSQNEIDHSMGLGYSDERKPAIEKQIAFFSGESGEKMKEAYSMMGQWKASLENLSEQYQRDALSAVMEGTMAASFSPEVQERLMEMYKQYQELAGSEAEDAGAQMGKLLARAEVIAKNEYNASEGAQLELASQEALINSIQQDKALNEAYYTAGYSLGKEFSKGIASSIRASVAEGAFDIGFAGLRYDPAYGITGPNSLSGTPSHAAGLTYVPYDNYPALLHEGERVLTASQARAAGGAGGAVSITMNGVAIREEADIEKVAQEIVRKINQALVLS